MQLFLYGVLREGLGEWPFLAGLGPGRDAQASGQLFAIADPHGWYPAMLPLDDSQSGAVIGTLHAAEGVNLAAVDVFEGSDYVRRTIRVQTDDGIASADVYLWAGSLPADAQCIVHGDFARWLGETGRTPYAGP